MAIKVGTDIVNISRVAKSIDKFGDRFIEKFLNKEEIEIANKIESIAGFWAAKEAVSKALGCGIGKELSFHDIFIEKNSKGAPLFTIKSDKFNILESSLSISHENEYAIAVVVIVFN